MQEFQKGDAEQGVWGTAVPSAVQGLSPGGGLRAKPPEATDIMLNSKFTTHSKRKLQYKDIYNTTKTGQT